MSKKFKPLNLTNKKLIVVSSQEALKDIVPINWSKDILLGKKKVLINIGK